MNGTFSLRRKFLNFHFWLFFSLTSYVIHQKILLTEPLVVFRKLLYYYYYYLLRPTVFAKQSSQYKPTKMEVRACPLEACSGSQSPPEKNPNHLEWPTHPCKTWPVASTPAAWLFPPSFSALLPHLPPGYSPNVRGLFLPRVLDLNLLSIPSA